MSEILVNTIKKADGTGSLTVPADTGTVLTTATTASSIPGYGNQITMADQWRISGTVSLSSGTGDVTTNWERIDSDSPATIGTGMSEASGIFTFPTTGKYLIQAIGSFSSANANAYTAFRITVTTDGSSYSGAANTVWGSHGSSEYSFSVNTFMFDVTNVTTHKVKFGYEVQSATNLNGSTNDNGTSALFIRLGDT